MKYNVITHPYAVQYGEIEVPDSVPKEEIDTYIENHWGEIKFEEPDLDYAGTDFEVSRN